MYGVGLQVDWMVLCLLVMCMVGIFVGGSA